MNNHTLLIILVITAGVTGLAIVGLGLLGTEMRTSYSLIPLNVSELAKQSDLIVIANVKEALPSMLDTSNLKSPHVWTDVVLDVEKTLKGPVNGTTVAVRLAGGTAWGITQIVSPEAELSKGERVLLFLKKEPNTIRGDHYGVLGAIQGKYLLTDGLAVNFDQSRNTSEKMLIGEIESTLRMP